MVEVVAAPTERQAERSVSRALLRGAINSFKSRSMWIAIGVGAVLAPLIGLGLHPLFSLMDIHYTITAGGAAAGAAIGAGVVALEAAIVHGITHATTEIAHEGLTVAKEGRKQKILDGIAHLRRMNGIAVPVEAKPAVAVVNAIPDTAAFQFDRDVERSPKIAAMVANGAERQSNVEELVAKGIEQQRRIADGGRAALRESEPVEAQVVYR